MKATLANIVNRLTQKMQPIVFIGSAFIVVCFVVFGSSFTKTASRLFSTLQSDIIDYFGWYYILAVSVILVFVIFLLFSPYGKIRLGRDDEKPQFSNFTWFTMLFSAGMGTGLVFWGVAEPMMHYKNPPAADPESSAALLEAFQLSFFHWGLHPWAIYSLFGVGIAFYHFRKNLPLAPRSLFYPFLGKKIYGWPGHLVDILATVGTLFGVATSLGLGAMQINAGLSRISEIPIEPVTQVIIIIAITFLATTSVVLGISKGISRLSRLNILLALLMLLFVFIMGPSFYILKIFISATGDYLQNLIDRSFWINPHDQQWQKDWTLFYWAWWISWSPFVGIFTARISRGRTIRQYILWVLLIPSLVTFVWLSVFGGAGLDILINQSFEIYQPIKEEVSISLHLLLEQFPLASVTSVLATLLITIYFITSSDSGSLVDDMVTSGGHPEPPVGQRIFWAFSEGAVAATLLIAGGLKAIRSASLTSGLPLSVILVIAMLGIFKALRKEKHKEKA